MSRKMAQYTGMEHATNCTTVDCLVGLDQLAILKASKMNQIGDFFPTVDGVSLPAPPITLIRNGP